MVLSYLSKEALLSVKGLLPYTYFGAFYATTKLPLFLCMLALVGCRALQFAFHLYFLQRFHISYSSLMHLFITGHSHFSLFPTTKYMKHPWDLRVL